MCIAIVKKQGAEISDEILENCFDNNKDGAGLAYAKDGRLHYAKGIFNKQEFIKEVRRAEKEAEGAMLIHCRIGTSGLMDKKNCHPHIVNNKVMVIHNGIIRIDVPDKSKVSDTVLFVERYLKKLPDNFLENDALCNLIEMAIGSYNKLAFLDNKGNYKILNEAAGKWIGDIWYSNSSWSFNPRRQIYVQEKLPMKWAEPPKAPPKLQLNEEEENTLVRKIRQLSNREIMELGSYPVFDTHRLKFVPETKITVENPYRYRYLDDLSEDAYEEYIGEIELRGLEEEIMSVEEVF